MSKSVAILTIGSLFWSDEESRQTWRGKRLAIDRATRVRAPIRYGRWSSRSGYMMVFSCGLGAEQFGWALAVPCRAAVDSFAQLAAEAEALWAAEDTKASNPGGLAAKWGAVGLLSNPNRTGLDSLTAEWSQRVASEHEIYKGFPSVDGEVPAVTPAGLLAIPWPVTESGTPFEVDLLLATPTVPRDRHKSHVYATPQQIATAFQTATRKRKYFDETRKVGISTAFDTQILQYLELNGRGDG